MLARHRSIVLAALLAALFAGGAVYSAFLGDALRYPDERDYVAIARHLSGAGVFSRDGIEPTAYRAPAYPVLLSLAARAGGGPLVFRLLNFGFLCATVLVLYHTIAPRAGPAAGLLAAFLASCYPLAFYTAGTLYPQTLAAGLLAGMVYLRFRPGVAGFGRAAGLGLLGGALILTVPAMVFAVVFFAVWSLADRARNGRRQAVLTAVTAVLVLTPWLVRNSRTFGGFVFVSTNGGLNLLLGNSQHTTPNAGVNVDLSRYREGAAGRNEAERDRYYRQCAVQYVLRHPARSARLYTLKFANYFNYWNELYTRSEARDARRLVLLVTYGPLLALAAIRLLSARRWPLGAYERFAYLLYLLNGAFAALFFTRVRFRLPFDFLLIGSASMCLSRLWRRRPPSSRPSGNGR